MPAENASSLSGYSAVLEMNFHSTMSLEKVMKSNVVKMKVHS